jgi:hypothetical protein
MTSFILRYRNKLIDRHRYNRHLIKDYNIYFKCVPLFVCFTKTVYILFSAVFALLINSSAVYFSALSEYAQLLRANCMEQRPSWEADSHSASQEIACLLWNPKVHYRVHKSLPLVPIHSHTNPCHTLPPYLLKVLCNIFLPSTPRSSEWSLPFRFFRPKFCMHFLCSATGRMIGGSSPGKGWEFFSSPPRPDRLWSPRGLVSIGYQGLHPWGKAAGSWSWPLHLMPRSKNAWSYTSTPPVCLLEVVISLKKAQG